jgi:hypothetical protein
MLETRAALQWRERIRLASPAVRRISWLSSLSGVLPAEIDFHSMDGHTPDIESALRDDF